MINHKNKILRNQDLKIYSGLLLPFSRYYCVLITVFHNRNMWLMSILQKALHIIKTILNYSITYRAVLSTILITINVKYNSWFIKHCQKLIQHKITPQKNNKINQTHCKLYVIRNVETETVNNVQNGVANWRSFCRLPNQRNTQSRSCAFCS